MEFSTTKIKEIDVKFIPKYVLGKDLAKMLEIDVTTLFRYQVLAKQMIPDYKKTHIGRVPLDRYQAWVLNVINVGIKIFRNKAYVERKIAENPEEFSRNAFEKSTGLF
jgi:hypothetical protein